MRLTARLGGRATSFCLSVTLGAASFSAVPSATASTPAPRGAQTFKAADWTTKARSAIDPQVFSLALDAANCAVRSGAVDAPSTLSVIDYSRPSTSPRLWVFDLETRELLYEELVAHGQGSGGNLPSMFSNTADSHQSSLGLFVTEGTYVGRNGYSRRLPGRERGYTERGRARAIVVHGAPYVDASLAKVQGRLGRSWGCPALREAIARDLIDRVKGGSLLFAYYPDPAWLASSAYLGGCRAAA
jgi:hypothetical protein